MKLDMNEYQMITEKNVKMKGPFVNRELSWIDFNKRVLSCAIDKKMPMNERLNFLGITESNLDEFISVRMAKVYNHQVEGPYKEILRKVKKFKDKQNATFSYLMEYTKKEFGFELVKPNKLNKKEKEKLLNAFQNMIFPMITPLDITTNEVNLVSGTSYIASIIRRGNTENLIVIPLLKDMDPIYQIGKKLILLEDVIMYYMEDYIFINQDVVSTGIFRVIKDGSVILSHDENRFIIERMEETIYNRFNSNPFFLYLQEDCDERIETILSAMLKIPDGNIYRKNRIINYRIFSQVNIFDEKESFTPFSPFNYEKYGNFYSIFDAISKEDILLHHPYDSYETVVKFIQHAAIDPNVRSIKQTLYRVSGIDSPIVNALCDASNNGKQVTVLVEIKARFDENNNIRVIKKLQSAGVNVITGNEFLKTHCKLCIVTRKENDRFKIYSHVGTGNYNEKTAKIYTDLSYFTSKQKIGSDLLSIFNILSGHSKPDEKLEKVYYSPINLRKQLLKCMDREIENAKKGKKAEIFIKVNSISDPIMVNKLYECADKGVNVNIICRGICSLIPRKNLTIKSIVGRFLEHSRIYYFRNGKSPEYYISSADLLTRNLDRRIEILISLKESNVVKQIAWLINVFKHDERNSFIQTKEGQWIHAKGDFDAQEWMVLYSDLKKQKKSWRN